MLFPYGVDGSHFEHNKIPHKMTCGLVSVQGWPLIQVKITKKDKNRTATRWPRAPPLNRDGRLIQVTNRAFVWANSGIFQHFYFGSLYFESFKYIDYVIPVEKYISSTFTHAIYLVHSNSKVYYANVILWLVSIAESECVLPLERSICTFR